MGTITCHDHQGFVKWSDYDYNQESTGIGTYVLKPNQPGLGSHVANAGYMVKSDYAGKGIGKAMICCSLFSGIRLFLTALLNKRIP